MDIKIYEDLYKIPLIDLPKIKQPYIGGNKLEIYSIKGNGNIINYKEEHIYKNGVLLISNGEKFKGSLNPDKTSLLKGQYEWKNHQIYSGYFNSNNLFQTKEKGAKGKITFPSKDKFECIFNNGYPKGNGKYEFYKTNQNNKIKIIEGKFDYNKNLDKLILIGEQILYDFDNNTIKINFENNKLNGKCEINTILNDNTKRKINIIGYFKKGIREGQFIIKDKRETFYLESNYKFGLKDGQFTISDNINNIRYSKIFNIQDEINDFFVKPITKIGKRRLFRLIKSLIYLIKFNKKFNKNLFLSINDIDLSQSLIGQNGFELLTKILFRNLIKINLENNNIEDINMLKNLFLDNISSLELYNNKIKDINIISKLNMNKIIDLDFEKNDITSIEILENCHFEYLNFLGLSNNPIKDISVLSKVHFINLQRLGLYNMLLNNIDILNKCNFPNLTDLELFGNKINNIDILGKCNFPKLYILSLSCNLISNINILSQCNFPLLYFLDLSNNMISDINIFEKCNFPEIKIIKLSNNSIKSLEIFKKTNFKILTFLELINNPINQKYEPNKKIIEKLKKMKNINGFDIRL